MMEFFNFIGGIFGYILWGAFFLVKNFGIAIMIFTIIIKLIMFPLSVKQQKSMAANARFQAKQQEILKNMQITGKRLTRKVLCLCKRGSLTLFGLFDLDATALAYDVYLLCSC